jgi:hypothetical protein
MDILFSATSNAYIQNLQARFPERAGYYWTCRPGVKNSG